MSETVGIVFLRSFLRLLSIIELMVALRPAINSHGSVRSMHTNQCRSKQRNLGPESRTYNRALTAWASDHPRIIVVPPPVAHGLATIVISDPVNVLLLSHFHLIHVCTVIKGSHYFAFTTPPWASCSVISSKIDLRNHEKIPSIDLSN